MMRAMSWIVCVAVMFSGCGGGGGSSGDEPPPVVTPDKFATVDATAKAAYDSAGITGMGLAIYRSDGTKVFERMYGAFSPDSRVGIASASKMVSGVVLFRLIDKGYLSLDSTTGAVLGWSGPQAAITLRQLLSFTSGMVPENACTFQATETLADCVEEISHVDLVATPGTRFDYGSTHLQVAARMAEVVVGKSWNAIFAAELVQPLGLPADMQYYTFPVKGIGSVNPLIAGGLQTTMNEYGRFLQFIYDKGKWLGSALLNETLFTQQAIEPYPSVVIGNSPMQEAGSPYRYGLTAWLECTTPATGCATISSPGAFGFTPWLDRENGYFAVLGMQVTDGAEVEGEQTRGGRFGAGLQQKLKPLIVEALHQ
jgi:D-alanyl-D-alanine-carboxypeptidase/D-alanyl-D-alanine-endopeptidase